METEIPVDTLLIPQILFFLLFLNHNSCTWPYKKKDQKSKVRAPKTSQTASSTASNGFGVNGTNTRNENWPEN